MSIVMVKYELGMTNYDGEFVGGGTVVYWSGGSWMAFGFIYNHHQRGVMGKGIWIGPSER